MGAQDSPAPIARIDPGKRIRWENPVFGSELPADVRPLVEKVILEARVASPEALREAVAEAASLERTRISRLELCIDRAMLGNAGHVNVIDGLVSAAGRGFDGTVGLDALEPAPDHLFLRLVMIDAPRTSDE